MPFSNKLILIIEDDEAIRTLLERGLAEEGLKAITASNGVEGLQVFESNAIDLVILDIMMPELNGLQVCAKIRETSSVPIILLTALGTSENVVLGLDMGADDYVVKPFKMTELLARIRTSLRRTELQTPAEIEKPTVYRFNDLELNDLEKKVLRNKELVQLTSTEYKLLLLFIQQPRKVFSRSEILERVWGEDYDMGTNVVDVYVNYLRKKIDVLGSSKLIHTMIGHGYVMREE